MLTKILVTLVVIALAVFKLLNRRPQKLHSSASSVATAPVSFWRRYGFVGGFSLLGASLLSYSVWYWYDQHKVVTVTIVSPSGGSFGVYHARKGDISETKMVTVEGVHIRFANSERLEILED